MPNDGEPSLVSTKVVADAFGISVRQVQKLTANGIIDCVKDGGSNRYNLIETVRKYVEYIKATKSDKETKKEADERRKLKADADLKRAKADMAELELRELEGSLHRAEDVEAVMGQYVYTMRSMLVALPGRLAVEVIGAVNASEASDIIKNEINVMMEALTEFRYDPEVYAALVRERKGWQDRKDEQERNGGDSGS